MRSRPPCTIAARTDPKLRTAPAIPTSAPIWMAGSSGWRTSTGYAASGCGGCSRPLRGRAPRSSHVASARIHPHIETATPSDRTKPSSRLMVPFSVLDLSPIIQGGDAALALRNTLDLARHAERLGYRRYWLAEHHNMPGIASAATAVVIGHVAGGTKTIRVGSGGIMLPNHAPLVIA